MLELNATERGNILLTHTEENWINAWIRLPEPNRWLQVAFRDCNYPALNVTTIEVTDEDLAAHIRKDFAGGLWHVNKMNLDGVLDAHGEIIEDETK